MGLRGKRIRAAIAHLAGDGCDLTDPAVSDGVRWDDATFYLGYLEELCGFRLTTNEVLGVARGMMREVQREFLLPLFHRPYVEYAGLN